MRPQRWALITRLVGATLATSAVIVLVVIGAVLTIDWLME